MKNEHGICLVFLVHDPQENKLDLFRGINMITMRFGYERKNRRRWWRIFIGNESVGRCVSASFSSLGFCFSVLLVCFSLSGKIYSIG